MLIAISRKTKYVVSLSSVKLYRQAKCAVLNFSVKKNPERLRQVSKCVYLGFFLETEQGDGKISKEESLVKLRRNLS